MGAVATAHVAHLVLRDAVASAGHVHARRRSVFVELRVGELVGWAECAGAEGPGTDPTVDAVLDALGSHVLELGAREAQRRASGTAPTPLVAQVDARGAPLAAAGALDAALLDLVLRAEGRSLASHLGVSASDVGFAGVVGVAEPGAARERAAALVAAGACRVRVKVSPYSGLEALREVLDEVPVPVVADANASLVPGRDDATVDELCELPLAWLEQPYPAGNLAAHAVLQGRGGIVVGLDESIRSVRSVNDVARYGAAGVVCAKPGRLGGIARTREVLGIASRSGIRSYVGGYFEAGLGRAVLGALAASHDGGLDGDVVAPCTYLVEDPCSLVPPVAGRQPLHLGPGCGPVPDAASLEAVATARA